MRRPTPRIVRTDQIEAPTHELVRDDRVDLAAMAADSDMLEQIEVDLGDYVYVPEAVDDAENPMLFPSEEVSDLPFGSEVNFGAGQGPSVSTVTWPPSGSQQGLYINISGLQSGLPATGDLNKRTYYQRLKGCPEFSSLDVKVS